MNEIEIIGLTIYSCEGTKTERKSGGQQIEIVNSNEKIIRYFLKFLRSLNIEEKRIRCRLKIIKNVHNLKECQTFWSKVTKIPINQFRKPLIGKPKSYQSRRNFTGMGTIDIIYSDTKLWKKIMDMSKKLDLI